ncbi:MAG: amidase [Sandaracinaceae bacterium]|nr:amidase [Sandaracinaceae bacterium]
MSDRPIWALDASALAEALGSGRLASLEIVEALRARAAATEPIVNGLAIPRWDEACREAERADRERAAGRARGPLHGVPFTVKENLDVRGLPSTLGLRRHADRVATEDAVVVAVAREAGMVLLGKSNVPQALISGMECDNPRYGVTRNPHAPTHGPGGSSGGEAALVASGVSPLGLGTDLGGSIRSPAAFCGVVGLKPTTRRWSSLGVRSLLAGQEIVRAQVGPLARSVRDLELALEALDPAAQAQRDPEVPPLPFVAQRADAAGLRVGVREQDGFLDASASVRRAVREAAGALEAAGATLVPIARDDDPDVLALYVAAVSSDGLVTAQRQLRGDTIADTMRELFWASYVPEPLRRVASHALPFAGEARLGGLLAASRRRSVADYWALAARRRALEAAELARFDRASIDVLLAPATVVPAVPIGKSRGLAAAAFSATARYNLVGFPAGVVPVTRARPTDAPRTRHRDRLDRLAAEVEAEGVGLPIAVQVVGRPFAEARLLRVMAVIEAWARAASDPCPVPVTPRA